MRRAVVVPGPEGSKIVQLAGDTEKDIGTAFFIALRLRPKTLGPGDWMKSLVMADSEATIQQALPSPSNPERFQDDDGTCGCSCASKETTLYRVQDGQVVEYEDGKPFAYAIVDKDHGKVVNGEFVADKIIVSNDRIEDNPKLQALWEKATSTCAPLEEDARRKVAEAVRGPRSSTFGNVGEDPVDGTLVTEFETGPLGRGFRIILGVGKERRGCRDWIARIFIGAKADVDLATAGMTNEAGADGCSIASLGTEVIKVNAGGITEPPTRFGFAIVKQGFFDFSLTNQFVAEELVVTNTDPESQAAPEPLKTMWDNAVRNCPSRR